MLKIDFTNPVIDQDMSEIDSRVFQKEKLYQKKIYISGASGMIASYFTAYLIWLNEYRNAGIQIYAGIRNREKALARFGKFAEKEYFHIVSTDVSKPFSVPVSIDYIVHAASLASPQYYGCMPVETMLPNIVGTNHLLEYAKEHAVQSFLFFSSGSVYGSVSCVPYIDEKCIGLFDFLADGNVYGESKRCGEALCRAYFQEFGVPTKSVRIHHTYGPTADIETDSRVFSEFANNIIQNRDIVLKSAGDARRAFCYMVDAIVGLFDILLSEKSGEVYNIGNPNEYISIAELAQRLVELFPEKHLNVIYESRNQEGYSASPEKRIIPLNTDKLKELGWKPTISVCEGFTRMIDAISFSKKNHS